jgi:hypothetical protein
MGRGIKGLGGPVCACPEVRSPESKRCRPPRADDMCPEFHQKLRAGTIGGCVSRLRQMDPAAAEAIVVTVPKERDTSKEARTASSEPTCRRAGSAEP